MQNVKVNDGVTEVGYSQRYAYSVIEVRRNGKELVVQRDNAILDPKFKPQVEKGGFLGHVTNQNEQSYSYEKNTEGTIKVITLRKSGKWLPKGSADTSRSKSWRIGERSEFYDYNF